MNVNNDADYDDILDIDPDQLKSRLKEPLDLKRLLDGGDICFEVDSVAQSAGIDLAEEERAQYFEERDFLNELEDTRFISDSEDDEEEDDNSDAQSQRAREKESGMSLFERKRAKMTDITEGQGLVFKRIVTPGDGPSVPEGALAYYHYRLYHEANPEPFDSTRFRRRPERQRVGIGSVLEGLDIALMSMKKKEHSVFMLNHAVMFGEMGSEPRVPKQAEIYAEIELLDYVENDEMEKYFDMDKTVREALPYVKVAKVVKQCREDGNTAFRNQRFGPALRKYLRAKDVLTSVEVQDEEEDKKRDADLLKLLINIAICLRKLNRAPQCIRFCNDIMAIDEKNVKAHYLKGVALSSLGDFDLAAASLRKANAFRPNDREILNAIRENNDRAVKYQEYERVRCSRMMGLKETPQRKQADAKPPNMDSNFAKRLQESLKKFAEDDAQRVYPDFDTKCFSDEERRILEFVADDLELRIVRREHLWSVRK